jgi:DNA-binding transcriptional MerR regulator
MASEKAMNDLFSAARQSTSFNGMTNQQIQQACQKYSERPDGDIYTAIENIKRREQEKMNSSAVRQKKLKENMDKLAEMKELEAKEHNEDLKTADQILENLFNI